MKYESAHSSPVTRTKHSKSACKFIEYLTDPEVQVDWCKNTGYFPVNNKTYDLADFKQYLSTNPYFGVAVNQIKSSNLDVQEAICGCSSAINTIIDNNIASAIAGKIDIDTAVKNMMFTKDWHPSTQSIWQRKCSNLICFFWRTFYRQNRLAGLKQSEQLPRHRLPWASYSITQMNGQG